MSIIQFKYSFMLLFENDMTVQCNSSIFSNQTQKVLRSWKKTGTWEKTPDCKLHSDKQLRFNSAASPQEFMEICIRNQADDVIAPESSKI